MAFGEHPAAGAPRPAWQQFLDQAFFGYLMPAAMRESIDAASAERFLCRLGGLPGELERIRGASLLAGRDGELRRFCLESLPALARRLPSRTTVTRRVWRGGFHGPLMLSETIKHVLEGAPNRFVTRARTRTFDLPENQLVRKVADRLLGLIAGLRAADLLRERGWGAAALACEAELRRILGKTPLVGVRSDVEITTHHEHAARSARGAGYDDAIAWHHWLRHALDDDDGPHLAKILAEGALRPRSVHTQFELAVLIKLVQSLEQHLECLGVGSWRMERSLVMPGREDVARFVRARDSACIKVFYDLPYLPRSQPLGARDRGVRHFFGSTGRIRPDITVTVGAPGQPVRAMVVEIKNSSKSTTWRSGYAEALAYRHEYADELIDWPKAVLVTAGDIPGAVSRDFEVVAVDWQRWVPDVIVGAVSDAVGRPALESRPLVSQSET